ncbi:MAG: ATP-binding protein [Candidatus Zixiibacteriota bacterium]
MLQTETKQKQLTGQLTTEGLSTAHLRELPWIARRLIHKLRNPLSVIMTAASQLDSTVGQPLDEDDVYFLQNIIEASEQLNGILERFDMFAGNRRMDIQACDINAICRREFGQIIASDPFRAIKTELNLDNDIPLISGDIELLRGMIQEVIRNACESAVEVQSGRVSLSTRRDGEGVLIRITDNGPGIPQAEIESIVCPFVTSRPGKAGIGLTIAQTVARRHGGDLTIASVPGETRIDISLYRK